MSNSAQHQKKIKDPGRIHITADVETNGSESQKELPFVIGVVGDYTGDGREGEPIDKYSKREFVEVVTKADLAAALQKTKAGLSFEVDNVVGDATGEKVKVNLEFNSLEDFDPVQVAQQIPMIAELLRKRQELFELKQRAVRNEELGPLLDKIVSEAPRGEGDS
jgi:type VI secretion system protein ImpB